MKILALCGSLRAASLNLATLEAMAQLAPAGIEVGLFCGLGRLPLFNPDDEVSTQAEVAQLQAAINAADALVIASPEYAHGVSSVIKNALDWMVGTEALVHKPVALINTSPRASFAHAALRETLCVMSARVIDAASIKVAVLGRHPDRAAILQDEALCAALKAALLTLRAELAAGIASPAAPANETSFLYQASVPVYQRYLSRLAALLRLAAEHTAKSGQAEAEILAARLAPDMLPFSLQVEIASNFAKRACAPLSNVPIPAYGPNCESFAALLSHLEATQVFLAGLAPVQMADAAGRTLESQAGEALVALKGTEFLTQYALPNFFFHLVSAYAILRQHGVAVGKADFDGFHQYPRPA